MWVPQDTRDAAVGFVNYWWERSGICVYKFVHWLELKSSKFYDSKKRYGKVNEHNSWIPRDFWLEDWEKQAIIKFFLSHPDEGYRRLAFMMIDAGGCELQQRLQGTDC